MTGAFLVPGNAGIGSAHGFPPGRWVNVVAGLERTATVGSMAGIELAYHQGSNHYVLKTNLRVIIRAKCF